MEKTKELKPLLVTTLHKGVFFGYGMVSNVKTITLKKARMCIYWSQELKGVLGLASKGPNENCKISFAVPSLVLQDVCSITEVTDEAKNAWETVGN